MSLELAEAMWRLEDAQRRIAALEAELGATRECWQRCVELRAQLDANYTIEIEAHAATKQDLTEERARLDWLEKNHHEFDIWCGRDDGRTRLSVDDQHGGVDGGIAWEADSLRAAIDAARRAR